MKRPLSPLPDQAEIKSRPLLLSERWVRALLEGRKTQTRRLIDVRKIEHRVDWIEPIEGLAPRWKTGEQLDETELFDASEWLNAGGESEIKCPFGKPGDRLWVKETFGIDAAGWVHYRADFNERSHLMIERWKSSRFMPRSLSRLELRVVDVRAQRLMEITEADVRSEGIRCQVGEGFGPGPGFKWVGKAYEGAKPGWFHTPQRPELLPEYCSCYAVSPSGTNYSTILRPWQCAWREAWDALHKTAGETWDANPWVWAIMFERI